VQRGCSYCNARPRKSRSAYARRNLSWKERKLFLTRFTAGLFTTTHVVSETSIDITGTIFIMLNESPAHLFMALRNVLDCSYDKTIFIVTLLQRTRPFHWRLLCTCNPLQRYNYITHNILPKKKKDLLKYFSQHWIFYRLKKKCWPRVSNKLKWRFEQKSMMQFILFYSKRVFRFFVTHALLKISKKLISRNIESFKGLKCHNLSICSNTELL